MELDPVLAISRTSFGRTSAAWRRTATRRPESRGRMILCYRARALAHEFDLHAIGNIARFEAEIQQFLRGPGDDIAGIERVVIDIHSDKFFRETRLHVAGELHGVGERLVVVVEGILDA